MNGVNPFQLIQMIKGGANPQQLMTSVLSQHSGDNEITSNLSKIIANKDYNALEKFARNVARERGIDFDKEFEKFKSNF